MFHPVFALPSGWFVHRPTIRQRHWIRQLVRAYIRHDVADMDGHRLEVGGGLADRREQRHGETNPLSEDSQRLHWISVIGDDRCLIESFLKGIAHQVDTKIHVRSFFPRFSKHRRYSERPRQVRQGMAGTAAAAPDPPTFR